MADPALQSFILARLKDFCDRRAREERDPVAEFLRSLPKEES